MNRILFLLIFCTFSLSETILIPEDYLTIQEGIDASVDGDTVLVADGDYVENLVLDKSIVLTSYAIYDNLDEWIIFDDYYFNQWVINNSHIENTRLIGSSPDDPDYGSVILITPDSEECIFPEIVGFTITGGSGTTIVREELDADALLVDVPYTLGGGILADVSDPHIHHNAFENNGSEEVYSGGATQLTSAAEDWSFNDRLEDYDIECDEFTEFRLSHNLYNGNDAQYGNTMANRFHEDEFDMSGSIFDVFDCGNEENEVSSVWVKVEPVASVDFNDGAGQLCAFTAPDVYVDPNIDQECIDEGCGTQQNPFKTITWALAMILPSEDNHITLHLENGTYSPETGEIFPIILPSYVNLEGQDQELTILDAQQSGGVIRIVDIYNYSGENLLSHLTIQNGYSVWAVGEGGQVDWYGGGIYMSNLNTSDIGLIAEIKISDLILSNNSSTNGGGIALIEAGTVIMENILIKENNSSTKGGGLYSLDSNLIMNDVGIYDNLAYSHGGGMYIESAWDINLTDVTIVGNTSDLDGGGIYLYDIGLPTLTHVIINDNTAFLGGGIVLWFANSNLAHVTISGNTAFVGGGIIISDSNPILSHVTISKNTGLESGGGIYLDDSNIIILTNSIIWDNNPESISSFSNPESIIISYSNIEGEWEGEGNIDVNPMFTDSENGDYTLQEGSPCIDAGTADIDGDGVDDIFDYVGLAPDMGAFEFGQELSNDEDIIPTTYTLKAPYPNPFNPSTTIEFTIPNYSYVSIKVYDIKGRLVSTLTDNYYNPGYHQIKWNGKDYSSGVYFVKMISEDFVDTQKLMLIK